MFDGRSALLTRYGLTLVCLVATGAVFLSVENIIRSRGESSFITVTNDNLAALKSRMNSYSQALGGLAGFLDASDEVTALDWNRVISALKIEDNLPGLTGLGYVQLVDAGDIEQFQAALRKMGVDDMVIHPETGQDQKLIVTYVEPQEANRKTRGLDLSFEEGRRTAALESRDTGISQTTPPIELIQADTLNLGFLLFRPYYQRGMLLRSVAERREAFRGWITAWLDASRMLSELTDSQGRLFNLRVIDLSAPSGQRMIFDSAASAREMAAGTFSRRANLLVNGRTWTLEWQSTPTFDLTQNRYAKWLFLIAGLIITWLVYLYMRSTHLRHRQVTEEVESKTHELMEIIDQNRSILLNAMVGIMVLDGEGRILQVNPAAEQLFGRSDRVLRNMHFHELVDTPAPDLDVSHGLITARSTDGKTLYLDFQRNLWVHKGERRQTVLISDETDKTLANKAMLESERRWNLALKGAEIGVYDIDLVTQNSVVSDTWRRLMDVGIDEPDIDFQAHFRSRVHPDDLGIVLRADRDCIAGLTERSISEFRIQGRDGWRWMHSDGTVAERDANNKALRFIGAQTDVTELREARDALALSEDRFRLVLANAPVGMAVLDLDGRITETNAAICSMTGYSDEELIGFRFVLLFAQEDVENLLGKIADLDGESNRFYNGEHRIIRNDGTFRWGELKVSCVVDARQGGEIYIIQIDDVTHKREVDRVKSEFVATVSHELRTPLTSIKGALDLVSRIKSAQLDAPARRLLEIATVNTDRLIYLVNDILDMEKISAGTEVFAYSDVSCKQMLREVALQIRPIAEKHNVKINWQCEGTDALIRVDPDRTEQVLLNLVSNACKFSFRDGEVDVGFSNEGTAVRFSVVDRGEGVPEDFRPKVFDRFSQADSSDTRRKGGTGLGLSISRQIVERMGGKIGFESQPGTRTEFWFTCPLANPTLMPDLTPMVPGFCSAVGRVKRILHLHNDDDFAAMVRASLDDVAEVVTVEDVESARVALADGSYDIIIIDWIFPNDQAKALLDDIELLQPQARVVALSPSQPAKEGRRVRTTETTLSSSAPEVVSWLKEKMGLATK